MKIYYREFWLLLHPGSHSLFQNASNTMSMQFFYYTYKHFGPLREEWTLHCPLYMYLKDWCQTTHYPISFTHYVDFDFSLHETDPDPTDYSYFGTKKFISNYMVLRQKPFTIHALQDWIIHCPCYNWLHRFHNMDYGMWKIDHSVLPDPFHYISLFSQTKNSRGFEDYIGSILL